ncbi:hypothetical protein ACGRSR_09975 [Vibrio owensii]|uniref:hypothetical protein n=1 Tax=Vibrio owensii TaxID=696485 RepID=UPI0037492350
MVIVSGKHKVNGEPDVLDVNGTVLKFADAENKFEYPIAASVADCLDIWNATVDGIRAVSENASTTELMANYFGDAQAFSPSRPNNAVCKYVYRNQGSFGFVSGTGEVLIK